MHAALLQRLGAVPHDAGRAVARAGLTAVRLVVVALATLASARAARAGEPVRLEWVRLEGAGACIDAAALEARVRQRLGSDPFDPRATRSIEGVVRHVGDAWHAEISVRAHLADPEPPVRELKSQAKDCAALSDAVVLAVALAIDPVAAFSEPAREPPRPPPAPRPPAPLVVAAPTAPPPGLRGRAELDLTGQAGLLPRASLGASLLAAAALSEHFELGLRARIFPAVDQSGDPSYAIGLALGTAQVCARLPRPTRVDVRACGGPSVGIVHASLLTCDRAQPGERVWVSAELGLDALVPLTRSLGLVFGARAAAPIVRYRFVVSGSDAVLFRQSAVGGLAHAGLELRFGAPR